jgi:hypothetical protein
MDEEQKELLRSIPKHLRRYLVITAVCGVADLAAVYGICHYGDRQVIACLMAMIVINLPWARWLTPGERL